MEKTQYTWNLGLLYKNDKDPQIEKDIQDIEKAYASFEKKYRNKDFTKTPASLLVALEEFETINLALSKKNPSWYFSLKIDIDSSDEYAQAMETKISQRLTIAANKVTFFDLVIGKIPKKEQKKFLSYKPLFPYKYQLEKIFATAKHNLSEKEEQLVQLLAQPGYSMWVDGQEKVLNQQTVEHNQKQLPLSEALSILSDLPTKERRALHQKINTILKQVSHFAEAEINAIVNFKKVMDTQRGFKTPYEATVLGYENDKETVDTLIAVTTKYFSISRRFYALHAKLLKEKTLSLADRGVKIGSIDKNFTFNDAVSIVQRAFSRVGESYAHILDRFLKNRQLDVFPVKGKTSGAYCSWVGGDTPVFVLLNHTNDIRSVETLAHEMGHAIHSELSKKQPIQYQGYSMATAEVASTFFEQLVHEELESELSGKEKVILLHNKILGDISTIFRQVACFNFEVELHTKIREQGKLSKAEMGVLMNKHFASYLGPTVSLTEDDGYFFVTWSHIRRFFYVYSYAYGQIISRALFENWKKDHRYIEKIDQFLSAGGSMSPKDIFKKIGINTSDPSFFESGLKAVEADIKKLERLAKKEGLL